MTIPKLYTAIGAFVGLLIVGVAGFFVLQPPADLVSNVGFSETVMTPNADGEGDIVVFSYSLSRTAAVSIRFENTASGQVFIFRDNERRAPGDYSVNFSGVVDGFVLDSEAIAPGDIERRLMPDGDYTWTFEATNDEDGTVTSTGTLRLENGDPELPFISGFEVYPIQFSPNQDGIDDRISVNIFLDKAADLTVYLEDEVGTRIYLPERILDRDPGDPGNHEYNYDGGVDAGFEPPEDGLYTIFAVAQDDEGQRVVRSQQIEINGGGLPQVEIAPQTAVATVCFSALPWDDSYENDETLQGALLELPESDCSDLSRIQMLQGDLLAFRLTVRNYGDDPVRTQGPFAGTVYNYEQLPPALGFPESDGAVRVSIYCQSNTVANPWRWGLGRPEDLTARRPGEDITEPPVHEEVATPGATEEAELSETADELYYLEAGEIVQVWGAIRMTEIVEERNPQDCYASLIHEGVRVFNQQVGARQVEILPHEFDS